MKKRLSNKAIYLSMLAMGLLVLVSAAFIGGNASIRNAQRTAERTLQYLRQQCVNYQDIVAADRVKSLVRLTEQAQELTERDRLKGQERSDEALAEYAWQQRMSCVLVLNENLEPEYSYGADVDWSDLYTGASVSNVMQYPEKIFARRLTRDGVVYDVAAAARTAEPGMVFCVRRQSDEVIASYHASIESLLAGYETLLNGTIYTYITDGETVVGSSADAQWNLPVSQVPLIQTLEAADAGSTLTRVDSDGVFFGARGMYQKYSLYVFLPADYVFSQARDRVISAFGVYALAVVAVALLLVSLGQERKRREQAYQRQLEAEVQRATQADQAKTDFLRSMSHDIRTPINIIMGMLEIISRSPEDTALVQSCREKAQTAAGYLLALVNDVLTLNRLEQKETLRVRTPYRLSAELGEVLTLARAQAEEAGIVLAEPVIDLEQDNFTGNPLYLRQICHNIIGNAIKYSLPGGQVRCSFREAAAPDGVCRLVFVCEDDGVGMSEEFQRHMFDAFTQEDMVRNAAGGVGLGLAVVKRIVDENNGTITVNSVKDRGTRFCVTMPLQPAGAEALAPLPSAEASIAGRRILVAEDNDLNREIAVFLLRDAGAQVTEAVDGRQAVEMFASSAPGIYDAILMDVMMPEMDGLTATRAIRALERPDASLPIIAMTANLFAEDVAACLEAGMDDHTPKPLEARHMVQTIAECIEKRKTV